MYLSPWKYRHISYGKSFFTYKGPKLTISATKRDAYIYINDIYTQRESRRFYLCNLRVLLRIAAQRVGRSRTMRPPWLLPPQYASVSIYGKHGEFLNSWSLMHNQPRRWHISGQNNTSRRIIIAVNMSDPLFFISHDFSVEEDWEKMELTEPGKGEIGLVEFVAANEVYIYI